MFVSFWSYSATWKETLLPVVADPDAMVSGAALWTLATQDRGDPEVLNLMTNIPGRTSNPARLRAFAASGLGLAGAVATNALPLRHASTNDPFLQVAQASRRAIVQIETAVSGSSPYE
jgi:hypothetical protein